LGGIGGWPVDTSSQWWITQLRVGLHSTRASLDQPGTRLRLSFEAQLKEPLDHYSCNNSLTIVCAHPPCRLRKASEWCNGIIGDLVRVPQIPGCPPLVVPCLSLRPSSAPACWGPRRASSCGWQAAEIHFSRTMQLQGEQQVCRRPAAGMVDANS
jgi:hypothetical protein